MTLRKFERQNPNILIAIWTWKDDALAVVRVPQKDDTKKLIRLLLISDGEKQHYCWIKDHMRLINHRSKNGHS